MTRTRGRGTKGEQLIDKVPHGHWKTLTFIAGLRHYGIAALTALDSVKEALASQFCNKAKVDVSFHVRVQPRMHKAIKAVNHIIFVSNALNLKFCAAKAKSIRLSSNQHFNQYRDHAVNVFSSR